ncbi:biorientation of chromosomes in cell division protein 1-like 1 [Anopheles moucheti]|uniref:biorientation of chromosomes in cell division protein 1-like 1 n=1 Tax=Anopheles moucheti TaxID=186751 RepID=UPI0022F06944|nr:biorientation of chromosomes in cell division protein 1-like 1 [Anopheles moucheti]XP_052901650.1 biorientation of chromosomes in cell division protein 1-like 1 [Anopheles moucheti]
MIDDPHFIDAMVQELKSQGLFDQFRKECLADVDTKPAYQNLRQRVEGTVNKFLGQQEWSDNIRYKNQLRDQLRKNIIESGFLDAGVERIVDQVVNPKIATIFQPKVEEIVYNYLGIEKPKSSFNGNEHTSGCAESLLEDLEAVSPDSDKKSEGCMTPSPPPPQQLPQPPEPTEEPIEHVVENMDIDEDDEVLDESKEQDDFESPAFEPLEVRSPSKTKDEMNDSNSSAISGLTSQESVKSDDRADSPARGTPAKESTDVPACNEQECPTTKDSEFSQEIGPANDSQLSQVSSNSQLLTATAPSSSEEMQPPEENERLDITEDAQMPTLFSSSMDKVSSSNEGDNKEGSEVVKKITFDFKKEEYDFVGTGRPSAAITCTDESFGDGNRLRDQEDDSTPLGTPMETPTDTSEKPKDNNDQPNLTLQDEETSQSEHSLKICEDTFSDENTKDSRSGDGAISAQDSPSKIKGLSDASSCSVKSDKHAKDTPSYQPIIADEKPTETEQADDDQRQDEERKEKKDEEEAEQNGKTITANKDDDHYQEHHKHQNDRRSSDRDSEDGNDKHGSGGSGAPPASEKNRSAEDKLSSSQESNEKVSEKEKSPTKDATDLVQSPTGKELDRNCRSVTPTGTPIDSSSSGIQSGDDSEKSPETLKSYNRLESIVLPVQPVVIDQMLTSADDSEIERLLSGETQTNDATLESLQRQWQSTEGKIRKPMCASNFYEARRLIRVRKQIQRHQQKCRAQALAMAKKYINENKAFAGRGMEDQGIELEFVCDGKRKSPGPLISSPVPKVEQPTVDNAPKSPVSDPELLYFPEEEEVYRIDEKQLNFLRSKTDGVTFGKNFKVQHYSTMICSLATAPVAMTRVSKRPTTSAFGSAKIRRTDPINGITKKLDLSPEGGKNGTTLAIRKQRSIRNRLVEKSTPPSVGTDA